MATAIVLTSCEETIKYSQKLQQVLVMIQQLFICLFFIFGYSTSLKKPPKTPKLGSGNGVGSGRGLKG
jgi:hypothetical protein